MDNLINNIKFNKLIKSLSKKNINNENIAWINKKLGGAQNGHIASSNLWYGNDITKKSFPNKNDILLLFPNSQIFNDKDIKTKEDLEKTIYDINNWESRKLDKNDLGKEILKYDDRDKNKQPVVILENNEQIKSLTNYFDYLIERKKISKLSKILKKAEDKIGTFTKETKASLKDKSKIVKETTGKIKVLVKNRDKSLKYKFSEGKSIIHNAIKDSQLFSLAKYLSKHKKETTNNPGNAYVHYNFKLFDREISNAIFKENNEQNKPYWYGDTLFAYQGNIKQEQTILLFPAFNFNKNIMYESINQLEKEALNKKNWKELRIKTSDLKNSALENDKKIESLSFYFNDLKSNKIIEPDKYKNRNYKKTARKVEKVISAESKANYAQDKLNKSKQDLEKAKALAIKSTSGVERMRTQTRVATAKIREVTDELKVELASRNSAKSASKTSENTLKAVYTQKMNNLITHFVNKQKGVGLRNDNRIVWKYTELNEFELSEQHYRWYGANGNVFAINPKLSLSKVLAVFPEPQNIIQNSKNYKDICENFFNVNNWEMNQIDEIDFDLYYKDAKEENHEKHVTDINSYLDEIRRILP